MAALLGAQGFSEFALRLTGWCKDKWISSNGYFLPRKHHDITKKLLKVAKNTEQSINLVQLTFDDLHTTFENNAKIKKFI